MAATHPKYSFVRLNEDGFTIPSCFNEDMDTCLPIYDLDDLRFQLITSFNNTVVATTRNVFIAAFPCQSSGDGTVVYSDIFSNTLYTVSALTIDAGGVFTGVTNAVGITTSVVNTLIVGDRVYISGIQSVGSNILGFRKVISKAAGITWLDVTSSAIPAPGCFNIRKLNDDGYYLSTDSATIPSNSEFPGSNYAWNFKQNADQNHDIPFAVNECFVLCIWKLIIEPAACGNGGSLVSSEFLGTTNCFKVISDVCYTSKLSYGCNEESFGFYTDGFTNNVRLPLFLSRPQYPSEEDGYQKSNGTYLKLSERINKEYEMKTDFMPEEWHERLRIALSCDLVSVTNENANLTEAGIYRKDAYEIEWSEDVDYPLARAKAKILRRQLVSSVNSNCA